MTLDISKHLYNICVDQCFNFLGTSNVGQITTFRVDIWHLERRSFPEIENICYCNPRTFLGEGSNIPEVVRVCQLEQGVEVVLAGGQGITRAAGTRTVGRGRRGRGGPHTGRVHKRLVTAGAAGTIAAVVIVSLCCVGVRRSGDVAITAMRREVMVEGREGATGRRTLRR